MNNLSAKIHYVFIFCALVAYAIITGLGVFTLGRQLAEIHRLPGLWIAMAGSVGAARFISMRLIRGQETVIDNVTVSYFVVFLFAGILSFL